MKRIFALFSLPILILFFAVITSSCTCGFDCTRDSGSSGPVSMTLSFYAVLPEGLKEVVLTIESITFRRNDSDKFPVDTFTTGATDEAATQTFRVDLIPEAASSAFTVISDLELDPDFYTLDIELVTADIESSYVKKESDDAMIGLELDGTSFSLQGVEILGGDQSYVVVFDLAQALIFNTNNNTYTLDPQGVRLQNENTSANLSGVVDSQLFNTASPCDEKTEPTQGNRIYLYQGEDLVVDNLADAFTSSSAAPSQAIAPFAVASLTDIRNSNDRGYVLNYLPAGDYTLAFACNAEEDDPEQFDDIQIPQPSEQVESFALSTGAVEECDLDMDAMETLCDI